jgi:SSS family solute:Na+ symporter
MEPTFANFAPADWLILLIYCFFALAVGFSLRPFMKGSRDFLQAGRGMPAWLCGMAMAGAGLNSQALLGMGAAGAHFGLTSLSFVALGSIPAMLFAGLYLMPAYYGSSSKTGTAGVTARSIPEYLGLRFDPKTRLLSACLFVAMALFSAGIELYAMARVLTALHIFDQISSRLNLSDSGLLVLAVIFPALLVLTYVLLGGLGATVYNQALQFCVAVAGSLPMIILGLKRIGGWNGLRNAVPAGFLHEWSGGIQAGIHSTGIEPVGLLLSVGLVLGGGIWCTDFRLLQTAMAAKDVDSARKAPLIAAALWVLVPTLLVLPGLIATGLPTPHTTIFIRNENGAIYHDIAVVPAAAEAGKGLVPAKIDPSNGKPMKDSKGNVALDYAMASPNMLLQVLPMGLLGLGIAALLACLMSGVAASLTAASTVFTCDLYQTLLARDANDNRILASARWAALGGTTLAIGVALATMRFNSILDAMLLVFAVVNGPLFAVLLLGAFWRHATGHGAFAGMIAGAAIALLHHGLDLPTGAQPGIHGGWIAVIHHPPNELVLDLSTATLAFLVSLLVTAGVSVGTKSRPKTELRGLVYSLMERRPANARWWKRPESLALAILLAAVAVNLLWI